MELNHNYAYKTVSKLLHDGIKKSYPDVEMTETEIYNSLSAPPNLKMGQVAFPCFPLAKTAKMAPPLIAKTIQENLADSPDVEETKLAGPYLNFVLKRDALAKNIIGEVNTGEFFKKDLTKDTPKTMVEYSQPNTHKILHVGHMRNLCLGSALINILRYSGQETIGTTYPGDMGTHVAKCLWYLKYKNEEPIPTEHKGAWLGQLYAKGNQILEDELGTDKEEENRKQLTAIIKEIESGKGELYDLWRETREWSIELMKEAYSWAKVDFDRWFFESEVDEDSLKLMKDLHAKGVLIEDDGAIGMKLDEYDLGFCILIKSDGTGMYSTKDVELARKKFEEFGIQKSIYVVDNRQAFHFNQVFKVLEIIGFEQAKDCYHLQYDVVELPDGAMSSRKGNIVPLMDLIANMENTIITNYLEKYRGDWSDEEISKVASQLAAGAIKYGMIRVDNNRKIVFNMDEWLKLDGETGPYLQYVYARINSLCQKFNFDASKEVNYAKLSHDLEEALLVKLGNFNSTVVSCAKQLKTIHLTSYLFELGKLFNSYYAECSIGNAEDEDIKEARLALAHAVGAVMKEGLAVLGIEAPERM